MVTRRNDKSPLVSWSVLVDEQRNKQVLRQADVILDGDRTLRNIQGIVISINWSTAVAEHLWTQKEKGYTSIQLIYTQWNAENLERLLEQHLNYEYY